MPDAPDETPILEKCGIQRNRVELLAFGALTSLGEPRPGECVAAENADIDAVGQGPCGPDTAVTAIQEAPD